MSSMVPSSQAAHPAVTQAVPPAAAQVVPSSVPPSVTHAPPMVHVPVVVSNAAAMPPQQPPSASLRRRASKFSYEVVEAMTASYIEFVRAHGVEPRGPDLDNLAEYMRRQYQDHNVPTGHQFYTLLYNKRKAIETLDQRQPPRTSKQKATHTHLVRMRDLLLQLDTQKNRAATEQQRRPDQAQRLTRKRPGAPLPDSGADDESSEAKRQRMMTMGGGMPPSATLGSAGAAAAAAVAAVGPSASVMTPMAPGAAGVAMGVDEPVQQVRMLAGVVREHLGRSQSRMDHMTDTLVKVSSLLDQIARSVATLSEQVVAQQHAQQQHQAAAAAAQQSQGL